MNDILTNFLSFSTLVFCLAVFAAVWVQRKLFDFFLPVLKATLLKHSPLFLSNFIKSKTNLLSKFYKEVLVPIAPIGTGGLMAYFVTMYPYPELFTNTSPRVFFGVVCGLVSAWVYKVAKKTFMDKFKKSDKE
jgi:hypothetical protein